MGRGAAGPAFCCGCLLSIHKTFSVGMVASVDVTLFPGRGKMNQILPQKFYEGSCGGPRSLG